MHRVTPVGGGSAPAVAVFCGTFLPYSQTFVWDELRCHERYAVEVFAWRRRNPHLFPAPDHVARPWFPLTGLDRQFEARFRRGGIALLHAHFGWAGAMAAPFARKHGLPLVISFHGYDVALLARGRPGPPRVWPYTLRRRGLLANLDLGLCASTELLEMLLAAGVPGDRLIEHRLGVDLERFRAGKRAGPDLRVAMVGRLVEKKGFGDGLCAFAKFVRDTGLRARLEIAGSGPLEGRLRRAARDLGVAASVAFLGELRHGEVANLLARSDVLLAPSVVAADGDRDSGLLTVKEASACECVPVATWHGGIPSIVDDGTTGFLVDEHDVAALADRLTMLARDPDRRRIMGAAARNKMSRQYELRASVRRLEEIYDEVRRRHKPSEMLSAAGEDRLPSSQK